MRIAFRHYLLDAYGALYRLPNAAFDRLLTDPVQHRLPRFAGQRVRCAAIAVALVNGKPDAASPTTRLYRCAEFGIERVGHVKIRILIDLSAPAAA